jgi:hypothetical protein
MSRVRVAAPQYFIYPIQTFEGFAGHTCGPCRNALGGFPRASWPGMGGLVTQGDLRDRMVARYLRHVRERLGHAAVIEWLNVAVASTQEVT